MSTAAYYSTRPAAAQRRWAGCAGAPAWHMPGAARAHRARRSTGGGVLAGTAACRARADGLRCGTCCGATRYARRVPARRCAASALTACGVACGACGSAGMAHARRGASWPARRAARDLRTLRAGSVGEGAAAAGGAWPRQAPRGDGGRTASRLSRRGCAESAIWRRAGPPWPAGRLRLGCVTWRNARACGHARPACRFLWGLLCTKSQFSCIRDAPAGVAPPRDGAVGHLCRLRWQDSKVWHTASGPGAGALMRAFAKGLVNIVLGEG